MAADYARGQGRASSPGIWDYLGKIGVLRWGPDVELPGAQVYRLRGELLHATWPSAQRFSTNYQSKFP